MEFAMDIQAILKHLPHRYPFLLVDRILDWVPNQKITGLKNVTINEPFFKGHFPGNPIMPGVLIVEAMAQVGGILARLSVEKSIEEGEDVTIFFMSIDKVKFRKPVIPGDQLVFEVRPLRTGSKVWKMAGKALVNNKLVAEAELMATIG